MFKKFLTAFALSAIFIIGNASAAIVPDLNLNAGPQAKLATFLEAPVTYANNEKIHTMVPEKVKLMFKNKNVQIIDFNQSNMALRTYKEDHRMVDTQFTVTPLNRKDLQNIGLESGYDYILFIKVTNSEPRISAGLFNISFKTTVNCDVRLFNVKTGQYIYSKETIKDGKSSSVLYGMPSFENAYSDALGNAFDEITKDLTKSAIELPIIDGDAKILPDIPTASMGAVTIYNK